MPKYLAVAWKGKKRRQLTVTANSSLHANDKKEVRSFFNKHDFRKGWSIDLNPKK